MLKTQWKRECFEERYGCEVAQSTTKEPCIFLFPFLFLYWIDLPIRGPNPTILIPLQYSCCNMTSTLPGFSWFSVLSLVYVCDFPLGVNVLHDFSLMKSVPKFACKNVCKMRVKMFAKTLNPLPPTLLPYGFFHGAIVFSCAFLSFLFFPSFFLFLYIFPFCFLLFSFVFFVFFSFFLCFLLFS